jgi:DNA polymerase-3 subunit alpha
MAKTLKITSLKSLGKRKVYDIQTKASPHNFILKNGVVAHNCFNKSHGILYSYISYITAYLKTHYPVQWMCACLTTDSSEMEKITRYLHYCRSVGITILPPDINHSDVSFTMSEDMKGIRVGLGAIKNIGSRASEIVSRRSSRKEGVASPIVRSSDDVVEITKDNMITPYSKREATKDDILSIRKDLDCSLAGARLYNSLLDLINRVPSLNSEQVETLISIGGLDSLGINRNALLEMRRNVWSWRDDNKRYESKLATYQKKMERYLAREKEISEGAKKQHLKAPVEPLPPTLPIVDSNTTDISISEKLSKEKELLGFYLSGHPLDLIDLSGRATKTIEELKSMESSAFKVKTIVVPSNFKMITTKKNKEKMAFAIWEDHTGTIESIIQPKIFRILEPVINTIKAQPQAVEIEGSLEVRENEGTLIHKLIVRDIALLDQQDNQVVETKMFNDLALLINFSSDYQNNKNRYHNISNVIWEREKYRWELNLKGKRNV